MIHRPSPSLVSERVRLGYLELFLDMSRASLHCCVCGSIGVDIGVYPFNKVAVVRVVVVSCECERV